MSVEATYSAKPEANGATRFTVSPAPAPGAGTYWFPAAGMTALALMAAACVVSGMLSAVTSNVAAYVILNAAVFIFGGVFIFKFIVSFMARRLDKKRKPGGEFTVTSEGIQLQGIKLLRGDITSLQISNAMDEERERFAISRQTGAYASQSAMAASSNSGANARQKVMMQEAKVSFVVHAESRGKVHVLAGGLTEPCARGLQDEVARLLQMK